MQTSWSPSMLMARSWGGSGRLGVPRPSTPASPRGSRSIPRGRIGARRDPDTDPTTSTYENTDGASQFIVNGLTNLTNAILGNPGEAETDEGEVGEAISPQALLDGLRREYVESNYLFTGKIDPTLYSRDCTFKDPTLSFESLATFEKNLENLGPIVDAFLKVGETTLYSIDLDRSRNRVLAKWRMYGEFKAFWDPILDIDGQTVFTYDEARLGKVVDYSETWGTPAGEALAQLVVPAVRDPATGKRRAMGLGEWIRSKTG